MTLKVDSREGFWSLCVLALAVLVTPLALYVFRFYAPFATDQNIWSDFGQYYGGVTSPALSALAFVALVATLNLQRKQIDDTDRRSQLVDFESTLRYYLEALRDILNAIDLHHSETGAVTAQGADVFRVYYRGRLAAIFRKTRGANPNLDEREIVRRSFDELYRKYGANFGHYFRTLYRAILYVHTSCPPKADRKHYVGLITCRLSRYEILLLAYNCLGSIGERKFKKLVEDYHLLEYIDPEDRISYDHLMFYDPKAMIGD